MTSAPSRRRFRWSLRTMFLIVAVTSIVITTSWHYWPKGVTPLGQFTPSDFASLHPTDFAYIQNRVTETTDEPILAITVLAPRKVEVETGQLRGPRDGEGHVITMEKRLWTWRVVSTSLWAA